MVREDIPAGCCMYMPMGIYFWAAGGLGDQVSFARSTCEELNPKDITA